MNRRRRGRFPAPPPPPPGKVWDLDEWVSYRKYAEPHVREMRAFDSLHPTARAKLRRTGESALAFLEYHRREQEKQDAEFYAFMLDTGF